MKNMINKIKTNPLPFAYFVIFVALLILCSLFPYTGDDWA